MMQHESLPSVFRILPADSCLLTSLYSGFDVLTF